MSPLRPRSFLKKFASAMFAAVLVCVIGAGTLFPVFTVRAAASVPTGTVFDLPAKISEATDKVAENIKKAFVSSIQQGFARAALNFTARFSASVGKSIASGGKGGKPLFDSRDIKDALEDAGDAALGDIMDAVGEGIGFNLCLPPDLRLNISLGLWNVIEPPRPNCTAKSFKENWSKFSEEVRDPQYLLAQLNVGLNPQDGETGQAIRALLDAANARADAQEAEKNRKIISQFMTDAGRSIGGTFPPLILQEKLAESLAPDSPKSGEPKLDGDLFSDLPKIALYNFFAAFTQKALERVISGEFWRGTPRPQTLTRPGGAGPRTIVGASIPTTAVAVNFRDTGAEFDALGDFAACPETGRTIYHCVIDQNLAEAIRGKLSVREAMTRGLLRSDWPFGFFGSGRDQEPTYDNGYAYNNMKKLRRARILPVGWEMAAEVVRSQTSDSDVTLAQVVAGFGVSTSPYYRLVDPNWVLTAPKYNCRARAFGQLLTPGSSDRMEYCVDMQDCVVPTEDGNGCKSWGYCTKERNIWRFDGRTCEPQFATCASYTRTVDSQRVAYLRNTVNSCDANAAGCKWYSTARSVAVALASDDPNVPRPVAAALTLSEMKGVLGRAGIPASDVAAFRVADITALPAALAASPTFDVVRMQAALRTLYGNTPLSPDKVTMISRNGLQLIHDSLLAWSPADATKRFFNRNVAECPANAVGCRAFIQLSKTTPGASYTKTEYDTALRSLTAPGEPGTYAGLPNTTATTLHLNGNRTDCSAAGTAAEPIDANVGCERYTPEIAGDPAIPAVVASGDRCPSACVGFDSYTEDATPFAATRAVQMIPTSARTCSPEFVGCEEFTNLDAAGSGGEARAFFTALRQCQRPATDSKTYFTWAGTETTGFALEVHQLKASNLDGGRAPCTTRRLADNTCVDDANDPDLRHASCDAHDDLATNPDCREFYDEQGNIAYRRMSRTIISDNGCIRYRRTITGARDAAEQQTCVRTGGAWDAATGCTYLALPSASRSCPASGLGCRAYKGTTANDVRISFNEQFEGTPDAVAARLGIASQGPWSAGSISSVSVTSGGRSLEVTTGATRVTLPPGAMLARRAYLVEFWARGSGTMTVDIAPVTGTGSFRTSAPLDLSTSWKPYTVGIYTAPDALTGTVTITWTAASFHLDNVRVKEMRDSYFLVKDSWRTPSACTSAMAGCRAYRDRTNTVQTFKSFGRICEDRFVGCQMMIDTKNSTSPRLQDFQTTVGTATDDVRVDADTLAYVVNRPEDACTSVDKGCRAVGQPASVDATSAFSGDGRDQNGKTRFVKDDPDTYDRTLCTVPNLGCEAYTNSAGGEEYFRDPENKVCEWRQVRGTSATSYGWFRFGSTATNPDCTTLPTGFVRACAESEDRCTEFRDPNDRLTTQAVIPPPPPARAAAEFFIDDLTMERVTGATTSVASDTFEAVALSSRWATEQGRVIARSPDTRGNTGNAGALSSRNDSGALGAYARFRHDAPLQIDATYRVRFFAKGNGSLLVWFNLTKRGGYFTPLNVPLTPTWTAYEFTRIVDPRIPAENGNEPASTHLVFTTGPTPVPVPTPPPPVVVGEGRSYHFIDDDDLNRKRGECNGAVSLKEGCVLFQNMGKTRDGAIETLYNSTATYIATGDVATGTETEPQQARAPVTCDGGASGCTATTGRRDANDLIKVRRDRTCAEWLTCISASQVYDQQAQRTQNVCNAVATCIKPADGNATQCGAFRDPLPANSVQTLSRDNYKIRDVSWKGNEYSGYSVPNLYDLELLVQRSFATDERGNPTDFRLANFIQMLEDDPRRPDEKRAIQCSRTQRCPSPDAECRFTALNGSGTCYENKGLGLREQDVLAAATKTCRAYPRADAPFPNTVVEEWEKMTETKNMGTEREPRFLEVPIPDESADTPKRLRSGFGFANTAQRTTNAECSYRRVSYSDGETRFWDATGDYALSLNPISIKEKSVSIEYGLRGYCLEEDMSLTINANRAEHPCLTWFPIDVIQGEVDVYLNAPEAGYQVARAARFYCVESELQEYRGGYTQRRCGSYPSCDGGYDRVARQTKRSGSSCTDAIQSAQGVLAVSGPYGMLAAGVLQGINELGCSVGIGCNRHFAIACAPRGGEGWYPFDGDTLDDNEPQAEVCTKFVMVDDGGENVAWTERLLGPNAELARTMAPVRVTNQTHGVDRLITIDATQKPYGAADAAALASLQATSPLSICNNSQSPVLNGANCEAPYNDPTLPNVRTVRDACRRFSGRCDPLMGPPAAARIRYICDNDVNRPCDTDEQRKECRANRKECTMVPNQSQVKNYAGIPYAYDRDNAATPSRGETLADGFRRLGQVFARTYATWQWDRETQQSCAATQPVCRVNGTVQGGNPLSCTQLGALCNPTAYTDLFTSTNSNDWSCVATRSCIGGDKDGADCSNDPGFCGTGSSCGPPISECNDGFLSGTACTSNDQCRVTATCVEEPVANPAAFCAENQKRYRPVTSTVQGTTTEVANWDNTGPTRNPLARGPRVRAAQYNQSTYTYSEGQNGITVETTSSGDLTFSRTTTRAVTVKFYASNDNGQQMPLRRVSVDWGDGPTTDLSIAEGSFKNHKAQCRRFCSSTVDNSGNPTIFGQGTVDVSRDNPNAPKACTQNSDCPRSGFCNTTTRTCAKRPVACTTKDDCGDADQICRGGERDGERCVFPPNTPGPGATDPDGCRVGRGTCVANACRVENWGDEALACTQNDQTGAGGYFAFTHIYRCTPTILAGLPACAATGTPTTPCKATVNGVDGCVFVPRAQVLDNWGWCNGTCLGAGASNRGQESLPFQYAHDPSCEQFLPQGFGREPTAQRTSDPERFGDCIARRRAVTGVGNDVGHCVTFFGAELTRNPDGGVNGATAVMHACIAAFDRIIPPGTGDARGCYNDPASTFQACNDRSPSSPAWTPFNGRVILKPEG